LRVGGDGGRYTTTDDLGAVWDSLFSHVMLSTELTATFLETHYTFDTASGYGCGVQKRLDDSMFAIEGGDAGVDFSSRYIVPENLTINILSNITHGEEMI